MSNSEWTQLHAQVHQILRQKNLIARQTRVLIALSGGQDSLCLTKLLLDLQPKWGWDLAIAHCDHGWSSDAGIADHVQEIAQNWNIPFYLKVEQVEETEAAARAWRYQALVEIAQTEGFATVVTGHTKSDRAETLLYNLFRGAGSDGLAALTWKRALTPAIDLVRPLLQISRSQTCQFCQQFQLPIWKDTANQNRRYARNRIRSDLLPYLQSHFNPQVETTLAQTAELLRAETEYFEQIAQELRQQVTKDGKLNRIALRNLPLALQRRVMRQFLQTELTKAPGFAEIEALTALISAPNRTSTSTLAGGAIAQVRGDWIIFVTAPETF